MSLPYTFRTLLDFVQVSLQNGKILYSKIIQHRKDFLCCFALLNHPATKANWNK